MPTAFALYCARRWNYHREKSKKLPAKRTSSFSLYTPEAVSSYRNTCWHYGRWASMMLPCEPAAKSGEEVVKQSRAVLRHAYVPAPKLGSSKIISVNNNKTLRNIF